MKCPGCGRAWVAVANEPAATKCPTCRYGREPLDSRVGGRTLEEVEHALRPAPPPSLEEQA